MDEPRHPSGTRGLQDVLRTRHMDRPSLLRSVERVRHHAGRVDDCVGFGEGRLEAAPFDVDLLSNTPIGSSARAGDAHDLVLRCQPPNEMPAQKAGCTGDGDPHPIWTSDNSNTRENSINNGMSFVLMAPETNSAGVGT